MEQVQSLPQRVKSASYVSQLQTYCRTAAFLFFLLMIVIGSIPGKAEALSTATHDKFLHLVAYSTLSILLYIGLGGPRQQRVLGTVICVALLGLVDETIQHFLPYRNSEAWDWLFNMLAAALSVGICGALQFFFTLRRVRIPVDEQVRRNTDRMN